MASPNSASLHAQVEERVAEHLIGYVIARTSDVIRQDLWRGWAAVWRQHRVGSPQNRSLQRVALLHLFVLQFLQEGGFLLLVGSRLVNVGGHVVLVANFLGRYRRRFELGLFRNYFRMNFWSGRNVLVEKTEIFVLKIACFDFNKLYTENVRTFSRH